MAKKGIKFKYLVNFLLVGALLVAMLVLDFTGGLKRSTGNMMTEIGMFIVLAVSLNLVVGFLGELSLGHAGFMCVGAYIGGIVAKTVNSLIPGNTQGFGLFLAFLAGGLSAAVIGLLICIPTLRLKGDYLAIVTLAFGEIIRTVFKNLPASVFGGAQGFGSEKWNGNNFYIVALVAALVTVFVAQNLKRSRHGRAIQAIRDNEIAARASGVNVTFYKLFVFTISSFFAGIAGVIYSFYTTPVMYTFFDFNKSIEILVMVVLGGMGNITGSIIAATLLTFINFKLTTELTGEMAALKYLFYALILIVMVIYNNAPKLAPLREKMSLSHLWEFLRRKFLKKADDDPEVYVNAAWDKIPTKIPMDAILTTDLQPNEAFEPDKTDKNGGDKS